MRDLASQVRLVETTVVLAVPCLLVSCLSCLGYIAETRSNSLIEKSIELNVLILIRLCKNVGTSRQHDQNLHKISHLFGTKRPSSPLICESRLWPLMSSGTPGFIYSSYLSAHLMAQTIIALSAMLISDPFSRMTAPLYK